MGLLSIFRRKPLETRNSFDKNGPEDQRVWFSSTQPSGVYINHDIALTYAAFWAAVRVISETVAQLPWHVFRRTDDGQERQATRWTGFSTSRRTRKPTRSLGVP